MKRYLVELVPFMTQVIINDSFTTGSLPASFRHANVVPRLKGSAADVEDLKSYRPIANLRFVGKLLERIASFQLHQYCHNVVTARFTALKPLFCE